MALRHFHQSVTKGATIEVDKVRPFYWCIVPPRTAWSTGGLNFTYVSKDNIPIERQGWMELRGYFIDDIHELNENLTLTPNEIVDDYIPTIDPYDFSTSVHQDQSTQYDESLATLPELTGQGLPAAEVALPGDHVEGSDAGPDVQDKKILSSPAVVSAVDWLGLGKTPIYKRSFPLGFPIGRGMVTTDNNQRYVVNHNIKSGMKASGAGKVGVVIFVASIPQLGSEHIGDSGTNHPVSPWATWVDMYKAFSDAADLFNDAMLANDAAQIPSVMKELLLWKVDYRVDQDTWENKDGLMFVRGSTTLSTNIDEERMHF